MSIRKRKLSNGKYTYQAVVERGEDENGKRLRETKTFKTKREAEAFLNEKKSDINNGTYIEPSKITVSQALDEWFETEVKPRLAPATIKSYSNNIENHIRPALGNILLQKLTPTNVQIFYNSLDKEKNLSKRSIKYIQDNLHCCLKHFVNQQIIPRNVCDFVTIPKKESTKLKNDFYTLEEATALLKAVDNDRLMPVFYFGMLGMRRSELLAITWKDIDFSNSTISINKNLVVIDSKVHIGQCKTKSSIRNIPVPETVMIKLKEHKIRQLEEKMNCIGRYKDKDLVICKLNGEYIKPATLSSIFPKLLKKYGMREIRLHDLRHTYCSLALNYFNIPASTVAANCGHASTKLTLDTYSHVDPSVQKQSAEAFEKGLFSNINEKSS